MSRDGLTEYHPQIARALATPGGHLSIGRGGATLYFDNAWLSGRDDDVIKRAAIVAGSPVIDGRGVPFEIAAKLAVRGPMVGSTGRLTRRRGTRSPTHRWQRLQQLTGRPAPRCSTSTSTRTKTGSSPPGRPVR